DYFGRSASFLLLKKWEQGAADFARVLQLMPADESFRRQLYAVYFLHDEAFAALVKLGPKNERHWQQRGYWHMRNDRPEKGCAELAKVIQLQPERRERRIERADLYGQFGMWKEAAVDYDVLFADGKPTTSWQWYLRAHVLLQQGDVKGYREHCRRMRKE